MPVKKPKNRELTSSQKLYNQLFSATRVVVEHANSGLKRVRMLKDVCRLHDAVVRDRIRVVACGLHNLRVASIDSARLYQTSSRLQACAVTKSEFKYYFKFCANNFDTRFLHPLPQYSSPPNLII